MTSLSLPYSQMQRSSVLSFTAKPYKVLNTPTSLRRVPNSLRVLLSVVNIVTLQLLVTFTTGISLAVSIKMPHGKCCIVKWLSSPPQSSLSSNEKKAKVSPSTNAANPKEEKHAYTVHSTTLYLALLTYSTNPSPSHSLSLIDILASNGQDSNDTYQQIWSQCVSLGQQYMKVKAANQQAKPSSMCIT